MSSSVQPPSRNDALLSEHGATARQPAHSQGGQPATLLRQHSEPVTDRRAAPSTAQSPAPIARQYSEAGLDRRSGGNIAPQPQRASDAERSVATVTQAVRGLPTSSPAPARQTKAIDGSGDRASAAPATGTLPVLLQNKVNDIDRYQVELAKQRAMLADILARAVELAQRKVALSKEEASLTELARPHLEELRKGP